MIRSEFTDSWDDLLEEVDPSRRDVYFREGYVKAYTDAATGAECFVARESGRLFLLPYLRTENATRCPKGFDASVAYGYGGPISSHDDPQFVGECCSLFTSEMRERGCATAFIRFHPLLANHAGVPKVWEPALRRHTVGIDLRPSVDEIWSEQIHPKHRNKIRQADANGLEFVVDSDWDHLDQFIEIYEATMRRVDAEDAYFFGRDYYERLHERLPEKAMLGLSMLGDEPLAAGIFLHDGPYGHYHLSGTVGEARRLRAGNHLVYHAALRLKELGCSFLHLGGGLAAGEDDALYHFKRRFGNLVLPFYVSELVFDRSRGGSASEATTTDL